MVNVVLWCTLMYGVISGMYGACCTLVYSDVWYMLLTTYILPEGFSSQCWSRRFLDVFTILLLTMSLGRAFQVVVILMG